MSLPALRLSDGAGGTVALRLESAPLGSGGDGSVYASTSHPELVAKLYHDPGRDPERRRKLLAMLGTPPQLDPIHHGGRPYVQLTWPTHLVEDAEGRFLGYAMPRVALDRAVLAETLLSRKTRKALRLPEAYGLRVTAASNLAAVVEALHARGHHVVDLKPVNAYVYRDTFFVALLDCDGFSVRGTSGERFPAHQYTPDYIAPEALAGELVPEALGEAQDRFALAVVVFQLLNGGVHPFQGVPAPGVPVPPSTAERMARWMYAYGRRPNPLLRPSPWSIHESFDGATRDLFDRAFGEDAEARPDAAEWRRHLARYADPSTGALRRCAADPAHAVFADAPSAECLQCALDARRGAAVARQAPARAPHSPTPTPAPAAAPPAPPSVRPAGARRWGRKRASLVRPFAWVVSAFVLVGGGGMMVRNAMVGLPSIYVSIEPCSVTTDSITPPDTIRTLLTRAAVLGVEGRAGELRATDWTYRDPQGRNAAHWAARVGNLAATRGLVLGRAAADLPDHDGVTPLMVAAGRADPWQVEALLGGRANPNAANSAGQTPLMYLAASCKPVRAPAADTTLPHAPESALLRLVAAGADLNAQDARGITPLMHATRGSGLRVRDLLAAGADPHRVDWRGRSSREVADGGWSWSTDKPYIQALLASASAAANWSALAPEIREVYLAGVDARMPGGREARDNPRLSDIMPLDSVFIPPYRP